MKNKAIAGMTLVETLVAIGLGSLVMLVLASVSLYSARSFSSMAEYSDLNRTNRMALDQISRDIRQSRGLASFTRSTNSTSLVFNSDAGEFSLIYDNPSRILKQTRSGTTNERVLLKGCTYFNAQLFQGSPVPSSFNFVPTTDYKEVKMVQLDWSCERRVSYKSTNSENVQSMKIVIRKRAN